VTPRPTDPPRPSYPPLEVVLEARKVLTGGSLKAGQFQFLLKDRAGKALETVSHDGEGRITFSPRRFSNPGDFVYSVTEQTGTDPDIQYDTTVYRAIIRVRAQGDRLTATVDLERNRTPYGGDMVFTNRKPVPPTGDKHLQLPLALGTGAALLLLAYALIQRKQRRGS